MKTTVKIKFELREGEHALQVSLNGDRIISGHGDDEAEAITDAIWLANKLHAADEITATELRAILDAIDDRPF